MEVIGDATTTVPDCMPVYVYVWVAGYLHSVSKTLHDVAVLESSQNATSDGNAVAASVMSLLTDFISVIITVTVNGFSF